METIAMKHWIVCECEAPRLTLNYKIERWRGVYMISMQFLRLSDTTEDNNDDVVVNDDDYDDDAHSAVNGAVE